MSASTFIRCGNCGVEFQSMFAGFALVRGSTERCPDCREAVNTPLLAGDVNFDRLQKQLQEPMVRTYGDDGYIFMGAGRLASSIESIAIAPVFASYDRNLNRALDLLDLFENVAKERLQLILGTVLIATMTAYECLTDDVMGALVKAGIPVGGMAGNLHQRREGVLKALGLPIVDEHLKALRYAYEIRNCLTHSAGVIDDAFIKKVAKLGDVPELTAPGPGTPLVLHRSMATSFLDSLQLLASSILTKAEEIAQKQERSAGLA